MVVYGGNLGFLRSCLRWRFGVSKGWMSAAILGLLDLSALLEQCLAFAVLGLLDLKGGLRR